ncbi:MAG: alpha,6-mannosyltransferase [Thermoleophilaceae bacterium]|nr:alpha,6-mannosyltransferase [Thermoleophilaceae bacterium]
MTATPLIRPRPLALPRTRSALFTGSLALIVVSGVTIALGAAAPASQLIRTPAHPRPLWLHGPLADLSVHITFAQFVLLEGAMAVGYAGVVLAGAGVHRRALLGAIAILHLAFLLTPPLLSTDIFSYLDYARLGVIHGIDPYAQGPAAAPHDAVFSLTAWKHVGSAYGPVFTLVTYPLAKLSLPLAIWSLKLLAAAASLGCVALVWRIAEQLGRSPARAAALFGLNPVLLVWTVGGAHNDLLMLMLALGGVSLALARREALGGAAVVAAAAVKATAGLALPFLVLGVRRWGRAAVGAVAAGAAVLAVAVVAFPGDPLGVVSVLSKQQHLVNYDSIPNVLAHAFGLHGVTAGVRTVAHAAFAVVAIALVVLVRRGYDWVAACGWAMVAIVIASPWLLAWYTIWPLPFAAVSRDRRLLAATVALELYFVANHIPQLRFV